MEALSNRIFTSSLKPSFVAITVIFSSISVFFKKNDVECFGRRIPDLVIKNAAAILLMYSMLFSLSGIIISLVEGLPLSVAMFETASAIGTVGLSLGVTPTLCGVSKIILVFLMFFGRVGGLTVIFATINNTKINLSKKPKEEITVG